MSFWYIQIIEQLRHIFIYCLTANTNCAYFGIGLQKVHLFLQTLWQADIIAIHKSDVSARRAGDATITGCCRAHVPLELKETNAAVAFFIRPDDLRRIILRAIVHDQ